MWGNPDRNDAGAEGNVMGDIQDDLAKAHDLPEGDVIRILLEQHVQIKELFARVASATGEQRQQAFDDLRSLLAVHETAEEIVVRPVTEKIAGQGVAEERNHEEKEATEVLKQLEGMDVDSADFVSLFSSLKDSVTEHAESEERD